MESKEGFWKSDSRLATDCSLKRDLNLKPPAARKELAGVTPETSVVSEVSNEPEPQATSNDLFYLPVHLGTQEVPISVSQQSRLEAERRLNLAKNNKAKMDGYVLWIDTMLQLQKIQETNKEDLTFFGPTVIVPKPNGAVRVTHDFSGLSDFTPLFKFRQEKIENIWSWASAKKYLIKIDFIKAFHAVPIAANDQKFYGFLGPNGSAYKYLVLPMGTRNSPALFAEYMEKSLQFIIQKYEDKVKIYQDDIAVAGEDMDETRSIANLIIDQMKLAGLKCNVEKTYWDPIATKPLLGAIWAPLRITQKPEAICKLQKLHDIWMKTRLLKDRQRYQGKLASLSNFPGVIADISANEATNGPEATTRKLLEKLNTSEPDIWKTETNGRLFVDASDGGIGALLETKDGKTIKVYSGQNRLHIPIFELEFLAIWKGVTKLRQAMKRFQMDNIKIMTDNTTVLNAFRDGILPKSPTSQYHLAKIKEFMTKEKLKFSMNYVPSAQNKADSLSRTTTGFSKSLWIRLRESEEKRRNLKSGI
eukprot:GHVP01050857.1.p1 GENE.GHVP01050857.1~~GHVP01050857.1.p1  ORF type:complete len:532 (+),score=63.93 GHVP01050857.1:513-2108(+)